MSVRPRVLILSLTAIAREPRVQRQVQALRGTCDITLMGLGPDSIDRLPFQRLPGQGRTLTQKAAWMGGIAMGADRLVLANGPYATAALELLARTPADLVIAHDVEALGLALMAHSAPVVVDLHEYAPLEFGSLAWRLGQGRFRQRLCRELLPRCAGIIAVAPRIAARYAAEFAVQPVVVPNATAWHDRQPGTTPAHGPLRLVHHGGAMRARRLELMCEAVQVVQQDLVLTFHLVGDPSYLDMLRRRYAGPRIRFAEPLPQHGLIAGLAQHDVGIFLMPPTSFNNHLALPNKFFDFIQARLALAVSPNPEMADLVRQHGLGLVADDFSVAAFAQTLSQLDQVRVNSWKSASHSAATSLCAEQHLDAIRRVVGRALGQELSPCAASPV